MTEMYPRNHRFVIVAPNSTIGKAFTQRILSDGANVVGVGRTDPHLNCSFIQADLLRSNEVEDALKQAADRLGQIDTLINFSGLHHKPMDLVLGDPDELMSDFQKVMNINATGAFLLTMFAARLMVPRRAGHIIHLCSNASRLSLYGSYGYNMSKHALEGLVKTAAAQLAPFEVRVNGIAPGTIETPLNTALLRSNDGHGYSDRASSILAHTPTKRFLSLEGICESLLALCYPQRHLTGNVIFCDDGYNIEGHSWPKGNKAVYMGHEDVRRVYEDLEKEYPRHEQ